MRLRLFMIAAILLAAVLRSPAASPTADSFNAGAGGGAEEAVVNSLAVQVDGKILLGGIFTTLGGQSRTNFGRFNANGSLDTTFNPMTNGTVSCVAVQADGKILVGGFFTNLAGQPCNSIGRLNADGNLDTLFNPGADSTVYRLALQADGKILVGGTFTTLGGQARNYIGRLNSDGSLDTTFNPGAGGRVLSLALQSDGKILVGGSFTTLGGQPRNNIGRLNTDGSLDTAFNPGTDFHTEVDSLIVQADGKILVGGAFATLAGQPRNNIGRLNSDGSLDTAFNPGASSTVTCLALQADGKILVGGTFLTLGGQPHNYIGRLNATGGLDTAFNPGAGFFLFSLALQPDGKTLAGGQFTTLGGQSRNLIGRLNRTDAATQNLTFDGSTITWLRGGTSPEVWRTTFDVCTNGTDWISLGAGIRITGGWQRTGLNYPTSAIIRARGFVSSATWFVETNLVSVVPLKFVNANGSPSISNGWFNLRLMGTTGSNAVVECSSNLVVWTPWQTNTLPAAGWDLALPLGANRLQFLRARLAP